MEGDLDLAKVFHLGSPGQGIPEDATPEARALYVELERLESEVDALRVQASQLDSDVYQDRLEALLLELARTNRSIRALEDVR